jgi:hypothetical protein
VDEFNDTPKYIRGRVTRDQVNSTIDIVHDALVAKHKILSQPRSKLSEVDLNRWTVRAHYGPFCLHCLLVYRIVCVMQQPTFSHRCSDPYTLNLLDHVFPLLNSVEFPTQTDKILSNTLHARSDHSHVCACAHA